MRDPTPAASTTTVGAATAATEARFDAPFEGFLIRPV